MTTSIPKGYALAIKSWENDADCYKTQTFYGLEPEEVKFLVALAKLFKSMNNHSSKGFGGGIPHFERSAEQWRRDVMAAYDKVVAKFEDVLSAEFLATWKPEIDEETEDEERFDQYTEIITELVGYPENESYMGGDYIRVYDSHTVHFYETSVPDVTKEFK